MFKSYHPPMQPAYEVRTPSKAWSAGPNANYPQKYFPHSATPLKEPSKGSRGRRVAVDIADFDNNPRLPSYMTQQPYSYPTPVQLRDTKIRSFAAETDRIRAKAARHSDVKHSTKLPSKKQQFSVNITDLDPQIFDEYSPRGTPPPPYNDYSEESYRRFQEYETYQAAPPSYRKTRFTPQKTSRPSSSKQPRSAPEPARLATVEDVQWWRLPQHCEHFSLKNWDPSEEPITLLGSVFDSNSLGKWIYDWTVFHHGAGAPMADEAGELWLSLIELASKRKRAGECVSRIRSRRKRQLVEAFIADGNEIWNRLDDLLAECEKFMWDQAKREKSGRSKQKTTFGSNSGCEFVNSIFGRDRELDTTLSLMNDIRCWTHDFNDSCEEILRRPRE